MIEATKGKLIYKATSRSWYIALAVSILLVRLGWCVGSAIAADKELAMLVAGGLISIATLVVKGSFDRWSNGSANPQDAGADTAQGGAT